MTAIRSLIAQRHLAMLLCLAALLMKFVVPTGYMIGEAQGRWAIILCPATAPVADVLSHDTAPAMTMAHAMGHVAMPDHGRTDHPEGQHGRAEMPCAFAGLSAAMLAAVDPIQWVALLAFVLATGFVAITATVRPAPPYLRPPLRGPPALS